MLTRDAAIVLTAVLGAGCTGSSPPDAGSFDAGPPDPSVRETELGPVRGVREGDTWVFRGIPFAAPPIGPLRFKPPEPGTPWQGTRDAGEFGPKCAQLDGTALAGSEDCLTVNVWSPVDAGAPLPVLVWFHGGDNMGGAASEPGLLGTGTFYDGQVLTREGLVFVSAQYRVGAFGFLQHSAFAADNSRSATGNWGLMDQLAALQWVQRNIAAFGGNPSEVTIAGQSAGADDSCALMASPRTVGLFQRAMLLSPGGCHFNDATVAAQTAQGTLTALGCTDPQQVPACLRAASVDALAHAPQTSAPLNPNRQDFYVGIDGWLLTESPRVTFREGRQARVPVIFGTTAEEYVLSLGSLLPSTLSDTEYLGWMNTLFGAPLGTEVVAAYDPADYSGSREVAIIAAQGDAVHHCSVRAVSRAAAPVQPVYRYVYGHTFSDARLAYGYASHGFDLPFFFGNFADITLTPDEVALGVRLRAAVGRFVKTGDPDAAGQDDWPTYDATGDRYAIVSTNWRTLTGFRNTQCNFWDGVWAR